MTTIRTMRQTLDMDAEEAARQLKLVTAKALVNDPLSLLEEVETSVYRGKNGPWYGHVLLPTAMPEEEARTLGMRPMTNATTGRLWVSISGCKDAETAARKVTIVLGAILEWTYVYLITTLVEYGEEKVETKW